MFGIVWSFGCPLQVVTKKLKVVKRKLKDWNHRVFWDISQYVQQAQDIVDSIQSCIVTLNFFDSVHDQEKKAINSLQESLLYQDDFWKKKCHLNQFTEGDRSIEFFHRIAKIKIASKKMSSLMLNEVLYDSQHDIECLVIDHFSSIYVSSNVCSPNNLVKLVIHCHVTQQDNDFLTAPPTLEEVKHVVFSISGDGAPRPYDFGGCFFQHFWELICNDLFLSVS